jgi:hypothetical protein
MKHDLYFITGIDNVEHFLDQEFDEIDLNRVYHKTSNTTVERIAFIEGMCMIGPERFHIITEDEYRELTT